MKTSIRTAVIGCLFIASVIISSCNNSNQNNAQTDSLGAKTPEKTSAKQSASVNGIKNIVDSYIKLKNALAMDNDKEAAASGSEMVKLFEVFDKSPLAPDQMKIYSDIAGDAKEHAEHIEKNAGNIKHQREHFETLSKDIYDLVNTFGGGQPLYLDHCPMYNNNKGAIWISETKDIQNPYLGKAMPGCGTVKEELKL